MNKRKHFSGEWFIDKGDCPADFILRSTFNGENYDIASFACDETGKIVENARLLVKAPDLLENLKNIIWNFSNYPQLNETQKAAIKYANELINKIENQ